MKINVFNSKLFILVLACTALTKLVTGRSPTHAWWEII